MIMNAQTRSPPHVLARLRAAAQVQLYRRPVFQVAPDLARLPRRQRRTTGRVQGVCRVAFARPPRIFECFKSVAQNFRGRKTFEFDTTMVASAARIQCIHMTHFRLCFRVRITAYAFATVSTRTASRRPRAARSAAPPPPRPPPTQRPSSKRNPKQPRNPKSFDFAADSSV